jgi:class 3 adenylate cyclase
MFAAAHPSRVSHLILFHGQARTTRTEGYEWAMSAAERQSRLIEPLLADWGRGDLLTHMYLPVFAAQDPRAVRQAGRFQRQSGTPTEVRPHWELSEQLDVREILSEVQAPTLVIDRPAATEFDSRHALYLAEHIPGARLLELPGRDMNMLGDGAEALVAAIEEFVAGTDRRPDASRTLSTVAFTDIVGSTAKAEALGDAGWRQLLERHDQLTRELVGEHGGMPIKSTGDGFVATFDGPARAVRCTTALAAGVRELDIELRGGVHTGEVELRGADIAGIAVHIGARIAALAGPGEVLASSTVRDLAVGSGIEFTDRGRHELKGVAESWRLFAASYPR